MSSYSEFKEDAKRWGISYILASILIFFFKAIIFLVTFGMLTLFSKVRKNKTINDNYYKI